MRIKIFLIVVLILSNLVFGEEIFLKENKFFVKNKNNHEMLFSGKETIKKKNFYGERIYKNGILIKEKIYNSDGSLHKEAWYDPVKKKGFLARYYKNGAFSSYNFEKDSLNLVRKFKNGALAQEINIKRMNFDTEKIANTQKWAVSVWDFPEIYCEEKNYDPNGRLLSHIVEGNKKSTYIKDGKKEIRIYSDDYKSIKQETYLENGILVSRNFAERSKDGGSYPFTRTETYSNDGTLSEVYTLVDGKLSKTYADNEYDGRISYKDGVLTWEKRDGELSKYKGTEIDYDNILYSQNPNYEYTGVRRYLENEIEIYLFGILYIKTAEDKKYEEFLDDFMKIKKIRNNGKEEWYYPNYKLKTYVEDYVVKRRYDESGKVVYDSEKNINDKEYLKLSNSGKNYKIFYSNGKTAYKKEKKPIKEKFLKQFDNTYTEETFYDKNGNIIYYCEDYKNQPQNLSNPGDEQSRFKPWNFLIRKVKRYGKSGKLIYDEDFKADEKKIVFTVNSYDEKTSAPLYKMEKTFEIKGKELQFKKYSLKIFKNGKLLSECKKEGDIEIQNYYYASGKLKSHFEYKDFKETYRIFYYTNGAKKSEKKGSEYISYFLNGKIESITNTFIKRGKETVVCEKYSFSGKLLSEEETTYKNSEKIKEIKREFYLNNELKQTEELSKSSGIEKIKKYEPDGLLAVETERKIKFENGEKEVISEETKIYDNEEIVQEIIIKKGKEKNIYYNSFGEREE